MTISIRSKLAALALGGAFVLSVHGSLAAAPGSAPSGAAAPGASLQPSASLSDAQIAAILHAANQIDIDNGKLAKDKTKSPQIKDFANRMVMDHESADKQAKALASDAKIKAKESDASKSLMKTADRTRDDLKKLKGAEFDRAYIDNEVTFHEQVIGTVEKELLPNAQNPRFKAFIEQLKPTLQSHLEHAKQVRSTLQSS
jgi:putative membrane protein